jgi:prevent-host-death family protein
MNITATEFKAKCLRLIEEVNETGEALVISKHGKPVVKVVPASGEAPWKRLRGKGRFTGEAMAPVIDASEIEALK